MNIDVAFGNDGNSLVGVGVVVRDHYGEVCVAFVLPQVGFFMVADGELFVIREALCLVQQLGLSLDCMETDSTITVKMGNVLKPETYKGKFGLYPEHHLLTRGEYLPTITQILEFGDQIWPDHKQLDLPYE
ncbi:hypothetical protein Dsin_015646 [Dipteronia sinensis]|uniref:RNase H type-1 domain-containing protein n=1 Tax=Dipteronia sinensis TaxID=43782 RepID=A0AAE0ACZ3_9ROSI|nr:hypothetical protein Dsin_015646 [Dipteronia sinensis]